MRGQLAARKGLRVIKSFKSEVFSGVAIESAADNVDSLEALDPVAKVWTSRLVSLEKSVAKQGSFADDASAPNYSIHGMTGVDRLHAAGIFGKGAKVGVVDTGTAYDHPAVGLSTYEGVRPNF